MNIFEISDVFLIGAGADLWGGAIELPWAGSQLSGRDLHIRGWVLGRSSPAVAVEAVVGGKVLASSPVALRRVDVGAQYPAVA